MPEPDGVETKDRKRSKAVFGLCFLTLLLALVAWRLHLASKDPVEELRKAGFPVTLGDLAHWPTMVPDSSNAGPYLKEAARLMIPLSSTTTLGTSPVKSEWEQTVRTNQTTLQLVRQASALPESRIPIDWTLLNSSIPSELPAIKQLIQILRLSILNNLEKGNLDAALNDLIDSLAICQALSSEPALIFQLVRIACFAISTGSLDLLLERQLLSDSQLMALDRRLADIEDKTAKSLNNCLIGERCLAIDFFLAPLQQQKQWIAAFGSRTTLPIKSRIYLGIRKMIGANAMDFDAYRSLSELLIEASTLPFPERLGRFEQIAEEFNSRPAWKQHLHTYTSQVVPALSKMAIKDAADCARRRNAALAIAIERYRLKTRGALPERLQQLVPEFLKEVPEDPFTGKPLFYKQLNPGYILYSVSEDLENDQGDPKKDIIFHIAK